MEFKIPSVEVDDDQPPPTSSSHYLSPSLQMAGNFSLFPMPLPSEEVLRWEAEKEQIRREILRRTELEAEVRRELAMEKECFSRPRPLTSILPHWLTTTVMKPVTVTHVTLVESPSMLHPPTITLMPEIFEKGKVIILDKSPVSENEEWSCALCEVKVTSESCLKAHLNGKKHKAKKAGQNMKIAKRNQKNGENVEESKKEEQPVKRVADNNTSASESKNGKYVAMMAGKNESESKIEEKLVETVTDNGVSVIKSTDENKLVEIMVDNGVKKFENGRLPVEKSRSEGCSESKKDAAIKEAEKISALTERRKVDPLWCEICQINTFSEAVMEAHLEGKKHRKKVKRFGQTVAASTELGVDAEKYQQFLQPCTALEAPNGTVVDKGVEESKKEEQPVKRVADNNTSASKSKNGKYVAMMAGKNESESKIEEKLVETVADNGVSVIKSTDENKLVEIMVDNGVKIFENGRLSVEKSRSEGCSESKKDAAIKEAEKISALTERRKVEPLWCEICQINTFSEAVMEAHVKGKKHRKKVKKLDKTM